MNEQQTVERCNNQLAPLESTIKALKIVSDSDYQQANHMDEAVRLWQKTFDEQRKSLTKPLDEAKKRIMAMFKPAEERADALREHLRKEIMRWNAAKEEQRKVEQARLDAEAKAKADAIKEEAEVAIFLGDVNKHNELKTQALITEVTPEKAINLAPMDKRKFKIRWRFEVVDLSLIPREYLSVDEVKVRSAIADSEGKITIPGIKNIQE